MVVIVDTSAWIDFLNGEPAVQVRRAMAEETVVLAPLSVAELLSGHNTPAQRVAIGELLQDFSLHVTPLRHWMDLGNLRRVLSARGINATIPDAHVAQCAIDLGALLLTRDDVFLHIAAHTTLRLDQLR